MKNLLSIALIACSCYASGQSNEEKLRKANYDLFRLNNSVQGTTNDVNGTINNVGGSVNTIKNAKKNNNRLIRKK